MGGFTRRLQVASANQGQALAPSPHGPGGSWVLTFQDEFEGNSIDSSKWDATWPGNGGQMNNVYIDPSNTIVSNSVATLWLSSTTSGGLIHTSTTTDRYQLPVGSYVEARVYFPGEDSTLYNWPAWWVSGPNWPAAGEHDIAEVLSGELTVNYHSSSGAHNQGSVPGNWANAFHVYGLHRKSDSADVYWDGQLVKSYSTDDNGLPEELIVNIGASGSRPVITGSTGAIQVDYVRAWEPA